MTTPNITNIDKIAEELFDYTCARRRDNLTKEGLPGDPRKTACTFDNLMEPAKHFYRTLAAWHVEQCNRTTGTIMGAPNQPGE